MQLMPACQRKVAAMLVRLFTLVGMLGCVGLSLGCAGQPRVVVITSTMVGLEAKPPMGDAQPNPSVSLGYRRAEMTLVPVCQVTEYAWSKDLKKQAGIESKEVKKKDGTEETPANERSNPQCPPKASKDADAYAAMGSFQMAHNWFGPLNIRQFIATGMAARHLVTPTVLVIGEVKKPGRYPFTKGLNVNAAIRLAGGKTDKAGNTQVTVLREGKGEESIKDTDLVSPQDTIIVSGQQWVTVIGEVNSPGRYVTEKEMTIKRAIEMAGGKTNMAEDRKVTILRQGKEGKREESLNDNDPISHDDTIVVQEQPWVTVTGAVKNPDRYAIAPGTNGKAAIEKAGGYTERAAQNEAIIRRLQNNQVANLTNIADTNILPGDTVHVPEKLKDDQSPLDKFTVGGAIKKPGSYTYTKGLTVRRAIELAGGRAENAKTGVVNVSRVMDGQNYTDIAKDLAPVLPNDVIYVEIDKPSTNKGSCFSPCQPQ